MEAVLKLIMEKDVGLRFYLLTMLLNQSKHNTLCEREREREREFLCKLLHYDKIKQKVVTFKVCLLPKRKRT